MTITRDDIKAMSAIEREELQSIFWDVIDEEPYTDKATEETDEELNVLRESLHEYERDPSSAKTWAEVYLDLRNRING